MAISNFIAEVWSAGVTTAFQKAQIVIPTLNHDYEGDAGRGRTVHIIGAVTPTITDYAAASRSISAEALSDTKVDLALNQEKAFSFKVDDVDRAQVSGSFDAWTAAAGGALAEDAEAYAIAQMVANAGVNANSGTPVAIDTYAKAMTALRAIRTALTKNKVPAADRYVAVNPAFADLLVSGLGLEASGLGENELRNGVVAKVYGLTVLETPLFAEATKPYAVGYHSSAVGFASVIDSTESLRDPASFSDIVRGLHVYGAKVVRPTGVVKYLSA